MIIGKGGNTYAIIISPPVSMARNIHQGNNYLDDSNYMYNKL